MDLNEDFRENIEKWINEIKIKTNNNINTIIYSISDINYKLRFDEMINTFDVPNAIFAMCAFDNETYDFFSKKIPTILLDKNQNQFNHLVLLSKFLLTYELLKNNYNVIMSEADIFWKVDIYKLFENNNTELLVSQHNYECQGEVNIGFYKVICNNNTLKFFYNLKLWIYDEFSGYKELVYQNRFLKKIHSGCADQKIFDCALRQCNDIRLKSVDYNFSQESINKLQSVQLKWDYISCDILMHVPLNFPNNHKGIHVWSGFLPPEDQIKYAYSYNWYYIKE
jgi:hypothetical protein